MHNETEVPISESNTEIRQHIEDTQCVVIGAGPAGLAAALEFLNLGLHPVVLEKNNIVGGLASTVSYKGFHFDMGGHRFYTKSERIQQCWNNLLGREFLKRSRLSRIYYRKKFFNYPPRLWNTLKGLGFFESLRIMSSYLRWQLLPYRNVISFEHWVTNAFGKRLFEIFFRTYTEKVWGIPCSELRAEWAAQRIKNLSLSVIIKNFVFKSRNQVTSLIEQFRYPRLGSGMMWEAARKRICDDGGDVRLNVEVVQVLRQHNRISSVIIRENGIQRQIRGKFFVSSMPISDLINRLDPPPPPDILGAARDLKHRDFLTVCLIIDQPSLFPDNWIYVHEPNVKVARIQNYKNWSEAMTPDPTKTSIGMEYFCNHGDDLWSMEEGELVALACREIEAIGLTTAESVIDGYVYRIDHAYPVYDSTYADSLKTIRLFCDGLENLRTVGRNGLHRYNNMDHSMLTGQIAARMLVLGEQNDLWSINAEQAYLEQTETKKN
ncbi:MAG: NAD(P)/FAD-dependent oxidoreductase [Gammaproteobacteria bacterium]